MCGNFGKRFFPSSESAHPTPLVKTYSGGHASAWSSTSSRTTTLIHSSSEIREYVVGQMSEDLTMETQRLGDSNLNPSGHLVSGLPSNGNSL